MSNARLEELRSKFQENPRRYFAPFANELRKTGDSTQAIAVCRTHLASQPGHVSGHIVLGQALYEAGEKGEAQTVFTAALELDPENLIALRTLGEIAQVNGEFSTARQWYLRLLDADPRNHDVTQLLRDLPEESTVSHITTPAGLAVAEEPKQNTTPGEAAAAEASAPAAQAVPAPRFHTSYTGAMPAFDPDRSRPQPSSEPAEAEHSLASSEEPFVDLQPGPHAESDLSAWSTDPVSAVHDNAPEALDVVEFAKAVEAPADFTHAESVADESGEYAGADSETEGSASSTGQQDTEVVAEFVVSLQSSAQPVEEPAAGVEPPHALFAEHGFDGPVDDDIGWLTTPSATYSDLEAAPEDWFAEDEQPATGAAPPQSGSNESETPAAATSAVAPDSDSWFDEAGAAPGAESAEMSDEDFWLPPELPKIANTPESAAPDAEEPVGDAATVGMHSDDWAQSEADTVPRPVSATTEQVAAGSASPPDEHAALPEPPSAHDEREPIGEITDVRVIAEAGEAAIFVEHHAEPEAEPIHAPGIEFATESAKEEVPEPASDEAYASASLERPPVVDSASVPGHAPELRDAAATPMAAPFITETLAELYLRQGFRDEALSIYRQLLDRNPQSQSLQDRIDAIEKAPTVEPAVSSEEATERAASQSVRTFFSRLARRQVASAPVAQTGGVATRRPETGEVPFATAASALANMFSASRPSASDENAASSLAGAFSDPAGRPARATDRELSLDHLFRDVAPTGSHGANVTLDEFYSTPNASTGSSTEPDEERSDEPGGSDIRQFTAWLEGLRKK